MAFALKSYADDIANKYGIPPSLFNSLINVESSGDISALSNKGAIGLTQLMPGTAEEMGVNAWDPFDNMEGGAKYLSKQYKKFGNWKDALAAYNAGAGNIKAGQSYADKVLAGAGIDVSSDQFITGKEGDVEFGTAPPGEISLDKPGGNSGSIGGKSGRSGNSFLDGLPSFVKEYGVILLLLLVAIVLIVMGSSKTVMSSDVGKTAVKLGSKALA